VWKSSLYIRMIHPKLQNLEFQGLDTLIFQIRSRGSGLFESMISSIAIALGLHIQAIKKNKLLIWDIFIVLENHATYSQDTNFFFFSFFFYYSYVHTRLGSFLPTAPTPSLSPPNTQQKLFCPYF
jgi:hypothetical protein